MTNGPILFLGVTGAALVGAYLIFALIVNSWGWGLAAAWMVACVGIGWLIYRHRRGTRR